MKVNAMSQIVTLPAKTIAASVRRFMRSAFTMDPIAMTILDNNYVAVHFSSRIWTV